MGNRSMRVAVAVGLLVALAACGDADRSGQSEHTEALSFDAVVGEEPFLCDRAYQGFGAGDHTVRITDLRLYIHDIELIDANGDRHSVDIVDDERWQHAEVALLDFTDGEGYCENTPAEGNDVVEIDVDDVELDSTQALAFSIGVPFEINHNDVSTAPSPLNIPAMFWNWNAGYKFLRVDIESDDSAFRFHLGSIRCLPDADGGVESCEYPNRPRVVVDEFSVGNDSVRIYIGRLFDATDIGDSPEETPAGCMATADDPDCQELFEQLGLTEDTSVVETGVFEAVSGGL